VSMREAVRFVGCSQRYAGAFLNAVPSRAPFRMHTWAFVLTVQRRLGLPLSIARSAAALHGGQRTSRHGFTFDAHGDVADNDGEAGHAERHQEVNRVIHRLLRGVWGAGSVQFEPLDSQQYSDHRPDITLHGLGPAGVSILLDLKLFSCFSSDPASLGRAGASVGFGNTRPAARELVLGLRGRGSPGDGCFNPASGAGYVAPKDGDYARALRDGLEVVPMLFETLGGFSSDFFGLLKRAAADVNNMLTSTQYEETTWSARSWMAFASQQISVALHLAVAHGIQSAMDARGVSAGGDPRSVHAGA
jgi:hypothetical protein